MTSLQNTVTPENSLGGSLADMFLEQAYSFRLRGEYTKALEELDMVLTLDPKCATAYVERGRCYYMLDDTADRAIQQYTLAIEAEPGCAEAYVQCGRAYFYKQDYAQAIEENTKAIAVNPHYGKAYGSRAGCYLQLKDLERAKADVEAIRQVDPNNLGEYYFRLGVIYDHQGNHKQALETWNIGLQYDSTHAFTLFIRGQHYLHRKQYQEAIADFSLCAQYDNPKPHCNQLFLGMAYMGLKDWTSAVIAFSWCLQYCPSYTEAFFFRARAYINLRQRDNALRDFDKLVQTTPKNAVKIYYELAELLFDLEEWQNTVDTCNIIMKYDPSYADAYYLRALAYRRLHNDKQALIDLHQTVKLQPKHAWAYYVLGNLFYEFNQRKDALKCYDRAIENNPKNANAYYYRSVIYHEMGKIKQAKSDYQTAVHLDPQIARSRYTQ